MSHLSRQVDRGSHTLKRVEIAAHTDPTSPRTPQSGGDDSVDQELHDDIGENTRLVPVNETLLGVLDYLFSFSIVNAFGFDPNEKTGPVGVGPENYIADSGEIDYTVYFENDPEFANAPAQVVTITDSLKTTCQRSTR